MQKRVDALRESLKKIDETLNRYNSIDRYMPYSNVIGDTTNFLLSHIAMSLAVIADKLTEDDYAKDE